MSDSGPPPLPPQGDHPLAPIRPEGYFGGVELLASDVRVLSLFADEARRRSLQRLFGIPRSDPSALVTLIALGMLGQAIGRGLRALNPPGPSLPDVLTGVGLVKELAYDIAGPWSRESSYFGTLLALAVVGASARVALRFSLRGIRTFSHQARADFDHRYGHLIRPNRPRPAATSSR